MDIGGMISPCYADPSSPFTLIESVKAFEQPVCWHEDLEIKLISDKDVTVVIDNEILTVQKDEIIFINPYQIHSIPSYERYMEENNHFYTLYMMELNFFQKAGFHFLNLRQIFMQNGVRIHNHIKNPRLTEILKKVNNVYGSQSAYALPQIYGLLLEFFSILLEEEVSDTVPEAVRPERIKYYHAIEPALEMIHMRYNEKISGEELSQNCELSLYYFYRIFKRVMGVTPVQYQTTYRLQIAEMLLKNSQYSISSISSIVGFEDEAYFSNCYKKYKGMSPREYRKNNNHGS